MPIFLDGSDSADSFYTTNLEGQAYELRFRWNSRSETWFMYIGISGQEYAVKTRLTVGNNLLSPYRSIDGVPPGSLYLADIEKTYGRPSRDDFGINKRFRLLYYRSTETDPLTEV